MQIKTHNIKEKTKKVKQLLCLLLCWSALNICAADLLFDLVVRDGVILDAVSGKKPVVLRNVSVTEDPEKGAVLAIGSEQAQIDYRYTGDPDILKGKGLTIEMTVKSDEALNGVWFISFGLGCLNFSNNKSSSAWINIAPTVKIYVEPEMKKQRFDYYPMATRYNGLTPLEKGKWNHVAFVFDEKERFLYSWVNGKIDRDTELTKDSPKYMKFQKNGLIRLFSGLKNAQVANLRIYAGPKHPADTPAVRCYLNQLPWQKKMVLTLDRINYRLPLPLEAVVTCQGKVLAQKKITEHGTSHLEMAIPALPDGIYPLELTLKNNGKTLFECTKEFCSTPVPENGKVRINADNSISYNGKKIMPIILYGVLEEDQKKIRDLGFNVAVPKNFNSYFWGIQAREMNLMVPWMKSAVNNGLYLQIAPDKKDKNFAEYMPVYRNMPNMLFWYNASEPWKDWEYFRDNYNAIRQNGSEFPIISVQCNSIHMKKTAPTCDIVACDPYPVPNVTLRSVAGLTRASKQASFGYKPVWTILGCYQGKIPTMQELRCMSVLALTNGAKALGIYSWDERRKKMLKNYYTGNYPETIAMLKAWANEIHSVEHILLEGDLPGKIIDQTVQPAIHASVKKGPDGKYYLLAANDQRCPEKAVFTLPASVPRNCVATPLPVFGYAGNSITFENGKADAELPPLAAAIFELKTP